MADNYEFFKPVVKNLEIRDEQIEKQNNNRPVNNDTPTLEYVREFFKKHPICGFDLSDHISGIYEKCPVNKRKEYFNSLLIRNNLQWREN